MKYAWIDTQRSYYALSEMCPVLEVSISGYRAWKRGGKADRCRLTDAQLLALIRVIHEELKAPTAARAWCRSCAHGDLLPVRRAWNG